jgi:hypothetical protein
VTTGPAAPDRSAEPAVARGPGSSRRALARFVLLAGALAVGFFLFRGSQREVTLVYVLGARAGVTALEVDIRRGDQLVRHAEFTFRDPPREVRHAVKLRDGQYTLRVRIASGAAADTLERALSIEEGGTVVLPL